MDSLYIVIPAYNEEETIEAVVEEWYAVIESINHNSRLVIIDDGSKDSTYKKLTELSQSRDQLVVLTKKNSGHGSTLLFGYNYAISQDADYIFQTDSDGQTKADDFHQFWAVRKKHDCIIGERVARQDGFSRKVVTNILKITLFLTFGVWVKDANTPFRLMNTETLKKLIPLIPDHHNLSNVLLSILYHKAGAEVNWFEIEFKPRQGGVNSINIPDICKIGVKALIDFVTLNRKISKKTKLIKAESF